MGEGRVGLRSELRLLISVAALGVLASGIACASPTSDGEQSREATPAATWPPFGKLELPNGERVDLPPGADVYRIIREIVPPNKLTYVTVGGSWMSYDGETGKPHDRPYISREHRDLFADLFDQFAVALPGYRSDYDALIEDYTGDDAPDAYPRSHPKQRAEEIWEGIGDRD